MEVSILDQICAAGKGVCEDATGFIGDSHHGAAWVIDGATGLGDQEYVPGAATDAAWYAAELSNQLKHFSLNDGTPETVFENAIKSLRDTYSSFVSLNDVPLYARPSAAGVWVRWKGRQLDYVSTGDCRAIIKTADAPARLIGPAADLFCDASRNQELAAQREANNLTTPEKVWGYVLPELRRTRATMNTENGYSIFSLDPETTYKMDQATLILNKPAFILLFSDGIYRLVDVFRKENDESLVQMALEKNLQFIVDSVRHEETSDDLCWNYTRIKPLDDASAILLKIS